MDSDGDTLDYIHEHGRQGNSHKRKGNTIAMNPGRFDLEGFDTSSGYSFRRLPRAEWRRSVLFDDNDDDAELSDRKESSKKTPPAEGKKATRRTIESARKPGSTSAASNKAKSKGNKTLTQMKFVHPVVIIKSDSGDEDDDVKLDYMSDNPKPVGSKRPPTLQGEDMVRGDLALDTAPSVESIGPKRRRLNDGATLPSAQSSFAHISSRGHMACPGEVSNRTGELLELPVTPRKQFRREVPSSQTPESPGFTVITSSQFREETKSPLKDVDSNVPPRASRNRSPSPTAKHTEDISHDSIPSSMLNGSTLTYSQAMLLNSPTLGDEPGENGRATPKALTPKAPILDTDPLLLEPEDHRDHVGRSSQVKAQNPGRSVVYETDAESDSEKFESGPVNSLPREKITDWSIRKPLDDSSQSHHCYRRSSASSQASLEPAQPEDSEDFSLSNASICYQRQHLATQFPNEPIPVLSTQKLNELFPPGSSPPPTKADEGTSSPGPLRERSSESQYANRTFSRSSPSKSCLDSLVGSFTAINDPIVQVESSQPADRLRRFARNGEGSGPQGILRRSQLLPESLLESIPMTRFYTGGQEVDIGEPYSLPDSQHLQ